jgi:hypothetical protein
MIRTLSIPAMRNDPDAGDRVTEIAGAATNALPFTRKVVGLKVAVKLTDVKLMVSGNSSAGRGLPPGSNNGPAPMFPRGTTKKGPPV